MSSEVEFKQLLCFDLSSYGVGLALINQFVEAADVKVFELSPCGSGGLLVLLSRGEQELNFIKSEAENVFKSQILSAQILTDINTELLPTYLGQREVKLKKHLAVLEFSRLSEALLFAQKTLKSKAQLVDIRVIRTFPVNVIVSVTADEVELLSGLSIDEAKTNIIENIQLSVRSFYEI